MSTEKKLKALRDEYLGAAGSAYEDELSVAESPIERLFLATMMARGWHRVSSREWCDLELDISNRHNLAINRSLMTNEDHGFACIPQLDVSIAGSAYRVDFAFLSMPEEEMTARLAVELDGHDFHERTKEQASRDKKRDRDFAAAGWTVLRFTGSDIYRDASAALREVGSVGGSLLRVRSRMSRGSAWKAAR